MNVPVNIQLGINGPPSYIGQMLLDSGSVGSTASWSGSFHILSMSKHYDEYVVTPRTLLLPRIQGFPMAHPYQRLAGKVRASGVTGNIGEAVAALFARRYLRARISEIAHITPGTSFKSRVSPDYMMQLGYLMPSIFVRLLVPNVKFTWPDWWPVEAKARQTLYSLSSVQRSALEQVTIYWSKISATQPNAVGYGLIVCFVYSFPHEVRVSLFEPYPIL